MSGEHIIGILEKAEAGAKTVKMARRHDISVVTIYRWAARFGGMEVLDAKQLRSLGEENARLK